jgi:glycosyl transferase family 25
MDFTPINQCFDRIYVITLKRATERHVQIAQQLKGLDFHFFYGADKNDFSIEALKQQGIYDENAAKHWHRYHKPMNGGQIGCSWSHRLVYEDMLQNGYKKILILEDDVFVNEAVLPLFGAMIAELPADWDLLYFDYLKNTHTNFGSGVKQLIYHLQHAIGALKWNHTTIKNLYARPFSPHLKKAGYHMYTSSYAITAAAAKQLIPLQTPIAHVADHLLAHAISTYIIKGFIAVPKLFEQESQTTAVATRVSYVED